MKQTASSFNYCDLHRFDLDEKSQSLKLILYLSFLISVCMLKHFNHKRSPSVNTVIINKVQGSLILLILVLKYHLRAPLFALFFSL